MSYYLLAAGMPLPAVSARLAGRDCHGQCSYLLQTLAGRAPNTLSVCTFLDRNSRRIIQVPVDFRCFEIPDRFVIGFGLDYNQFYRNLGYVAVMKPERS